jgi:hypothetical protein
LECTAKTWYPKSMKKIGVLNSGSLNSKHQRESVWIWAQRNHFNVSEKQNLLAIYDTWQYTPNIRNHDEKTAIYAFNF